MPKPVSDKDFEKIASKYSTKSVPELRFLDTGFDNFVVIVDNEFVVRFARSVESMGSQKLEIDLLKLLTNKKPPIPIPKIIEDQTDNGFMVYRYIPGRILKDQDIFKLTNNEQAKIGQQLAEFALWLGDSIGVENLKSIEILPSVIPNQTWASELENEVPNFINESKPNLTKITQNLWTEFKSFYPNGITTNRVIHNDLYSNNLIFGDDNSIIGVIDFADTGLGDIYCELKDTFLMSKIVMNAAIEQYKQLTDQKLESRLITLWSQLVEIRHIWKENYQVDHVDTYRRSLSHIKEWFPKEDWSEL